MMRLERAVVILNRFRHRGRDTWHIAHLDPGPGVFTFAPIQVVIFEPDGSPTPKDFHLDDFEAIAVAEQYARLYPAEATA